MLQAKKKEMYRYFVIFIWNLSIFLLSDNYSILFFIIILNTYLMMRYTYLESLRNLRFIDIIEELKEGKK